MAILSILIALTGIAGFIYAGDRNFAMAYNQLAATITFCADRRYMH